MGRMADWWTQNDNRPHLDDPRRPWRRPLWAAVGVLFWGTVLGTWKRIWGLRTRNSPLCGASR